VPLDLCEHVQSRILSRCSLPSAAPEATQLLARWTSMPFTPLRGLCSDSTSFFSSAVSCIVFPYSTRNARFLVGLERLSLSLSLSSCLNLVFSVRKHHDNDTQSANAKRHLYLAATMALSFADNDFTSAAQINRPHVS